MLPTRERPTPAPEPEWSPWGNAWGSDLPFDITTFEMSIWDGMVAQYPDLELNSQTPQGSDASQWENYACQDIDLMERVLAGLRRL